MLNKSTILIRRFRAVLSGLRKSKNFIPKPFMLLLISTGQIEECLSRFIGVGVGADKSKTKEELLTAEVKLSTQLKSGLSSGNFHHHLVR